MAWPTDHAGRWKNKLNKTPPVAGMGIIFGRKISNRQSAKAFDFSAREREREVKRWPISVDWQVQTCRNSISPATKWPFNHQTKFWNQFPLPPAANLTSAFEWRKNLAKSFWGSVFWGVSGFMTGPDLTIRIEMDLSSVSAGCCQWGVLSHRCDLNTNQREYFHHFPFSAF